MSMVLDVFLAGPTELWTKNSLQSLFFFRFVFVIFRIEKSDWPRIMFVGSAAIQGWMDFEQPYQNRQN